jgi:hypothetical protein
LCPRKLRHEQGQHEACANSSYVHRLFNNYHHIGLYFTAGSHSFVRGNW